MEELDQRENWLIQAHLKELVAVVVAAWCVCVNMFLLVHPLCAQLRCVFITVWSA